jgi:LysM repeat protein
MRHVPSLRTAAFLLAGVLAPLFLTQCKTTTKSYKDISYDPSKLKTPSGHGMERNDYPFDEQGNYRKDWVKGNSSGRDRSASPGSDTAPAVAAAGTETAPQGSAAYPSYAEASAARQSGNFVGPAGATDTATSTPASPTAGDAGGVELASAGSTSAPASSPSYHKVTSGDTLFSLATRYNTSVSELKRVNGLTGDSIRAGQSLRIP